MVTIATDARRVVRALPTPRAPEADASRELIRRRMPRRPAFAAVAPRVRARLRVAPAPRPQNRPQGGGALCFRQSIFDSTAHPLTAPLPFRPQSRDAMNEPVPSVPRKARTGTALDGIERGTRASALPARGFPSLARCPSKRRSAAFSIENRATPRFSTHKSPRAVWAWDTRRVIRPGFRLSFSNVRVFFSFSPSPKSVPTFSPLTTPFPSRVPFFLASRAAQS